MTRLRRRRVLAAVLACCSILGGAPAAAFELFGIHLWGARDEDDDGIAIIDPLPFTVQFRVEGGGDTLEQALRNASALWSDRDTPASGLAGLLAKAKGDYRRILAALYNAGYYGGEISIRAAGAEVADLTLDATLPAEVPMVVLVRPGPAFRFGVAAIVNPPPAPARAEDGIGTMADLGFETGERARATAIGAAAVLAVNQWREASHATARETGREVIAQHPANRLDVVITLDPGPPARYGAIRVEGGGRIDPGFVAFMTGLREGDRFDPDEVAAAQARLSRLGVFRSIRIEEGTTVAPDGTLPMTVQVEDRRPRSFGFGGTLSTIDGIGVEAFWVHRNLFGRAERLRFDAGVAGLGGSLDPNDFDYNVGVSFEKPGVWTPDTSFFTGLVASDTSFETYDERALTATAGIRQLFGSKLTGEVFLEVSRSRIDDDFGVRKFLTIGPVGRATYDRRDDPLDATRGYFVAVEANAYYEAEFETTAVRGTLEGRGYRALGAEDRFVLAGRTRIGGFGGAPAEESPPDQLFFAGGGGSVRGFAYRSIGIEITEPDGKSGIVGGKSLLETSAEVRTRINDRFGAVGFVDAGIVGPDSLVGFGEDWSVGAGIGVRYFTGLGPLRFDLAAPLDPRPGDSAVALYIGIGQAF